MEIIFAEIHAKSEHMDVIYLSHAGLIVDKSSGKILRNLSHHDFKPYYWFELVFHSYKYQNIYNSETKSIQQVICGKKYHFIFHLNVSIFIQNPNINKHVLEQVAKILTVCQINDFLRPPTPVCAIKEDLMDKVQNQSYCIPYEKIFPFITYRESHPMYFIPWEIYRLDNKVGFDLKNKRFVKSDSIQKTFFRRTGGIIETTHPNVIMDRLCDGTKSTEKLPNNNLIIAPSTIKITCKNATVLTYDNLVANDNSIFKQISKNRWDRIIIRECHINFLPSIKKLLSYVKCDTVWIINILPLRFYFTLDSTPHKLRLRHLVTISNIWMNLSHDIKRKNKTSIARLLFTKFNQYYSVVKIPSTLDCSLTFSKKNLIMKSIEVNIFNQYKKWYDNWLGCLDNNPNNQYSIASKKKIIEIKEKLFNSYMGLITRVVSSDNVSFILDKKITRLMCFLYTTRHEFKELYNAHVKMNKQSHNIIQSHGNELDLANMCTQLKYAIEKLSEKEDFYCEYIEKIKKINYSDLSDNTQCPICYGDFITESDGNNPMEKLPRVVTICSHTMCVECFIDSMTTSNECPICREHTNTEKAVIVRESLSSKYTPSLVSYLNSVKGHVCILSELDFISDLAKILIDDRFKYVNPSHCDVIKQLKIIKKINKVIIINSEPGTTKYNSWIGYFNSFTVSPTVTVLQFPQANF
jgi:hypothetical protein